MPHGAASISESRAALTQFWMYAFEWKPANNLGRTSFSLRRLQCRSPLFFFIFFFFFGQEEKLAFFEGRLRFEVEWRKREKGPERTWAHWRNATEKEESFLRGRVRQPDPGAKKKRKKKEEVPVLPSLDTVSTLNSLYSRFQRQALAFVQLIGGPL